MTPEDAIREEVARQGFVACGFAHAGPAHGHKAYVEWLEAGYAADMHYLQRRAALRRNPRTLAQDACSIIAVAARYPVNMSPHGGFATYARGADYHDVLRGKLRAVIKRMRAADPACTCARICVDSAPLLEREWAARAGLGWRGRQGQLVHPTQGACLVLGFILTDLTLPASTPLPNQCGDCRRCLDACPTGAAMGGGGVDARRCLSYLTIEHDGAIPEDWAAELHGALFGCDCCTATCPYNPPNETPGIMPELRETARPLGADELAALDEDAFARRFRGTAVHRSGLARLQRNARLAGPRAKRSSDRSCKP